MASNVTSLDIWCGAELEAVTRDARDAGPYDRESLAALALGIT